MFKSALHFLYHMFCGHSAFFTDYWKRRNAEVAYDWDVLELGM